MLKKLTILLVFALLLVPNTLAIQGDLDLDGDVDFDDFFKFADQFGSTGNADFNGNGVVDFNDFLMFTNTFGDGEPNASPVINEIAGSRTVSEGQTVTLQVQASDAENDHLTYSINSNRFIQNGNSFAWQTNHQNEGTYTFRVTVSDATNSAIQDVTINVLHADEPSKTADFNGDGRVDFDDFFLFADRFGSNINQFDLNNNGRVDYDDFFMFADGFGESVEQQPIVGPTTADLNGDGVINFADFEIFVNEFGNGNNGDLNNDGRVDYDDFFLFVDQFGQVIQIPDDPQLISNSDPRNNAERVNSRLRTFSFDSAVSLGQQVQYELYLIKGGNFNDNSANIAALNDIKDISNNQPVRTFTSSSSRPLVTLENMQSYTIYYWRIKATTQNGEVSIGPVWKFFTHGATANPSEEFVPPAVDNQKPIANILSPVTAGSAYTNGKGAFVPFKGSGSDVDGSIMSYEWLIEGITHVKGADKNSIMVDLQNTPGNYLVQFRVQDDKGLWSEWTSFNLNIVNKFAPNRPSNPDPSDRSNPQFSSIFQPYGGLGFSATGGDRDSTSGVYRIQISTSPDMSQIIEDKVINVNENFNTANPNMGISNSNFVQGRNFWWRVVATDSDGLTTYSPVWTFGPGVTPISITQVPPADDTFTPGNGGSGPSDGGSGPSGGGPSGGTTPTGNVAPVLTVTDKTVNELQTLTFAVTATDANGDSLIFGASGLPSGASFAGQTFTWTPTVSQSGNYQVTFTASDGKGGVDTKTITITVNNINQGPVLNPISNINVNEGQTAVILAIATDIDNDPITYSISDSRFKQESPGRFVWATWFDNEGVFSVTVTASTPDGLSDSKVVRVEIDDTKVRHPRVEVKQPVVLNEGLVTDDLELYINVFNNGNTDDMDTMVVVRIPELDIYEPVGIFSLDSGSKYIDVVRIDLSNAVSGKEYYFIVEAENNKAKDTKYGSFIVA
ncbi:putative Ig domain-containing protein [Candidatus Woesearchaeota archaeon]|nr:putative Ig domain-containing protein [Candidatus Woesearchaeota archaeon]